MPPEAGTWRPAVREVLPGERIRELVLQVRRFPELPVVTRQIMLALQDPSTSAQQVGRLAGSDPALAARILRVVNSAFFNLSNKIVDLPRAIVLLGYTQVRNLVLQGGVGQALVARDGRTRVDLTPFWYHSFCTATCAFYFAKGLGGISPGHASTIGLLHDIGKPVMWWAASGPGNPPLPPTGLSSANSIQQEEETRGTNHMLTGALLAVRWGLPAEVVRGIEYHHHPSFGDLEPIPEEAREQVACIWLADQVAHWFTSLSEEESASGDMSGAGHIIEEFFAVTRGRAGRVIGVLDSSLHRDLLRARVLMELHPAKQETGVAG